jgi:sigma-B regulation protein RsbU (phosphoserine phosphatase)
VRHPAGYRQNRFERVTRSLALLVAAPLLLALTLPSAFHIAKRAEYGYSVLDKKVLRVEPGGPAERAGMRAGDRITAVDGRPVPRMMEYYAATAGRYRLEPLALELEREGHVVTAVLQPVPPSQSAMVTQYTQWISGLAFLLIGWWVLARRADPEARHFFAMCAIFAFFLIDVPDVGRLDFVVAKAHVRALLQYLLPAYVLRFFLQFPSPWHPGRRGSVVARWLAAPAWLLFAVATVTEAMRGARPAGATEAVLGAVSLVYMIAYFLIGLVRFGRNALRRDRPIRRTKMLVILGGLTAGLVPFLVTMALGSLAPGASAPHLSYLGLSLLLVPASFALAIMRYGALDTAFVVRIGLIYGTLTALVVIGYLLVTVAVGTFLSTRFAVDSSHVLVLLVAATALVIAPLRGRVQRLVDLAFYPSRRANREAIARLADRLTGLIEADAVLEHLGESLGELFRPRSFAIVLAGAGGPAGGGQARGFSARSGWTAGGALAQDALPADNPLTGLLDRVRRPVFREELEDFSPGGAGADVIWRFIGSLDAELLVPMVSGNRLLGFLSLGPKSGGQLYGQEDVANLQALAVQAGPVVESRQLYEERLRVRRLETELEVARGIQANLLPVAPLETPQALVCGRNEPCRTVGGDYFDYFTMEDGRLALAIGDVAGKGIPAALMMSSLRVAFRLAAERGDSPRAVVGRMNPVVASLVAEGSFICFFYAVWDPASGLLAYCNAGMEPPVLMRRTVPGRQVLRKGGPVLGVEPDVAYREGTVRLEPGDRLFLFTDGLTEQRSPEGEFFDAERLLAVVEGGAESHPAAVLEHVFATVDAFGHRRRSDDQTAMLLHVKQLADSASIGP